MNVLNKINFFNFSHPSENDRYVTLQSNLIPTLNFIWFKNARDSETCMTVQRTIVDFNIKLISHLIRREGFFFFFSVGRRWEDGDYWEDEYPSSSSKDW